MKKAFRLLSIPVLVLVVSACNAIGTVPSTGSSQSNAASVAGPTKTMVKQTLYILNSANPHPTVAVYTSNGKTLLRTVDLGAITGKGAPGLLVDSKGEMLASNGGLLSIYDNQGATLVKTLKQSSGFAYLTLDSSDNLYTTCGGRDVCEYAGLQQKLSRRLKVGGASIATDKTGNVAIASGDYNGAVVVFPPTGTKPSWTIDELTGLALAFDRSGNLYVSTTNGIAVYTSGSRSPTRTISVGSGSAYASTLDFDAAGNLYAIVGNRGTYSILVYAPNGNTPIATIDRGLDDPISLAFLATKSLYVANRGHGSGDMGSVSIYQKLKNAPITTVTNGIYRPAAIGLSQ
jgi:hypothetical protein